jgi:V8-like Glu-specific endopeptidase
MLKQLCGKITRGARALFQGQSAPARPTARLQLEALEQREVMSVTPVGAGSAGIYRAVVEVQATFPNGKSVEGTGALINGDHVLTAGHVIYSAADGGYATSVKVTPEQYGERAPFGVAFGTFERVDPSWINFSKTNPGGTSQNVADIGLVTLNRAIGYTTGWFTPAYNNNNAFFANAPFLTAGYPALNGAGNAQMYVENGRVMGASGTNGIAFHQSSLPVAAGQSGSPLWQTTARGGALLYGVVTGANGFAASNIAFASRITQAVDNELMAWERVDRMPAVYSNVTMASQVRLQHPAVAAATVRPATTTPAIVALDAYDGYTYRLGTYDAYGNSFYRTYNQYGTWTGGWLSQNYSNYRDYYSWDTSGYNGGYRNGYVNPYDNTYYYNTYDTDGYSTGGWSYDYGW